MSASPRVGQQILVIDVETTGFDPQKHACIELGAVLLNEALEPVVQFSSLIAPWKGAEVVPQAMAVNHISPDELRSAPPLARVVEQFYSEVLANRPTPLLSGWNVWFDAAFLRHLFGQAGRDWPFRHRLLDVQSVVSFHMKMAAVSQEVAIREGLHEAQAHRALPDAAHTARLLRLMADRHWRLVPSASIEPRTSGA